MLLDLLMNHQIPYILGSVTVFGILWNLVEDSIYKRYLRQVAQMERKPKSWPGQLRTRFESYYKRKTGVRKVDLFVKNSLDGRRFLGIRLRAWNRIGGQFPAIVLAGGIASALYAGSERFSAQECIRLLGFGALFGLCGWIAGRMIGACESRERLQNALNDYFSNFLRPRLEQQYIRRTAYILPISEGAAAGEAQAKDNAKAAKSELRMESAAAVEEAQENKTEELRKKRREEREKKAERERMQQQNRLAERRRRAEERAKRQQEALQAAYEEKKRKLENKYIALQKSAMPEGKAEETPQKQPEKEIACTAENLADPDFIEEVLREYLL